MPPASEVLTLCFHTRDAVERDDSSMTFEMPGGQLRTEASRVALASCEFPMVQWTIEEDWSRLYLNEGVRLDGGAAARTLSLLVADRRVDLVLPRRLAPARCSGDRRRLVVECGAPHGLFSEATREPNRAAIEDGGVHLLGGPDGDLVARAAAELEYVSATAFALVGAAAARGGGGRARYVLVPAPASPARLCEWLTHAARDACGGARLALRYDAAADRVRMSVTAAAGGDAPTAVRVLPSPLARRLGLSTAALRVPPPPAPATVWPSEATGLWDYVELPPGFYGPAHRPMCTGQPLRLGAELENAVNRLYFPLGKPTAASAVSPHALVFSDPDGRVHSCAIPSGRYTPEQLCAHLEAGMATAAAAGGAGAGLTFSVSHFDDRFAFACERADPDAGGVAPAPFGLLWHHPLSVDPERFGFAAQPLTGADTYVAPRRTRVARVDAGDAESPRRCASNVVRVAEVAAQKRFSLHGVAPPALVGVLDAASALERPVLRTHLGGRPFAHGLQAGDVVQLARQPGPAAVADGEGGAERDAPEAPVAWRAAARRARASSSRRSRATRSTCCASTRRASPASPTRAPACRSRAAPSRGTSASAGRAPSPSTSSASRAAPSSGASTAAWRTPRAAGCRPLSRRTPTASTTPTTC